MRRSTIIARLLVASVLGTVAVNSAYAQTATAPASDAVAVNSQTGDDSPLERRILPASLQIDRGEFPIETHGQIQYDFAYVANPGDRINITNLGYNGTARRDP